MPHRPLSVFHPSSLKHYLFALLLCIGTPCLVPSPAEAQTSSDIARWGAAVVTVLTETGHGSGFHIEPEGTIVTSHHVIQGSRNLRIRLQTGEMRYVHYVVWEDAARDLALLRVDAGELPTVPLGNSDRMRPGDDVFAIGSPVGLDHSVTKGIVSQIRLWRGGVRVLQTQTPTSKGNSGGPLFNAAGQVVGVVTFKLQGGENLNFAVAINELRGMVPEAGEPRPILIYRKPSPPRPLIQKVQFWNGLEIMAEAHLIYGEVVAIERDGGQLLVAQAAVARVVNTQDGTSAVIAKTAPAPTATLREPQFVEGPAPDPKESAAPPSKPGRPVDLECYANAVDIDRDSLRIIRFNVVELIHKGKRLIVELEDLTGSPAMMESQARVHLDDVLRTGQNRVVFRGPERNGRVQGALCVGRQSLANIAHMREFRVRR